jgi:MOSC domain-containing protein YiiM
MIEVQVVGLYLGDNSGIEKTPVEELVVDCGGIVGDRHYGFTRAADGRNPEYPVGELIRNNRQWSAIAPQELAAIARAMKVERIDPAWIGANLCLVGIPNLSQLPKGTKIRFPQDAVLVVEDQNMPCRGPGKVIASKYPPDTVNYYTFPKAAMIDKETSRRGVIGVVEYAGTIALGDVATVELYKPRAYSLPLYTESQ